jgi:hypothetical protein
MLTQDKRADLELKRQFCLLLEFCTSGRRFCSDNPYSIPEIREALQCWASIMGRHDWLGQCPREDAERIALQLETGHPYTFAETLTDPSKPLPIVEDLPTTPHVRGVLPALDEDWPKPHEVNRIGENPVKGLMLSLFPIRSEAQVRREADLNYTIRQNKRTRDWQIWETRGAHGCVRTYRPDLTKKGRDREDTVSFLHRRHPGSVVTIEVS